MFQYDPITEQILRTERLLLKLRREYESLVGDDAERINLFPSEPRPGAKAAFPQIDPLILEQS